MLEEFYGVNVSILKTLACMYLDLYKLLQYAHSVSNHGKCIKLRKVKVPITTKIPK